MKISITAVLLLTTCALYAQNPQKAVGQDDVKFNARDSIRFDQHKNTIMLYGSADFFAKDLNIKADKVVYNQTTKRVTAIGLREYSFDKTIKIVKNPSATILHHTIGEDTVYIK